MFSYLHLLHEELKFLLCKTVERQDKECSAASLPGGAWLYRCLCVHAFGSQPRSTPSTNRSQKEGWRVEGRGIRGGGGSGPGSQGGRMVGCGRGCGLRLEMSLQMCVKERSSTGAELRSKRGGRESPSGGGGVAEK